MAEKKTKDNELNELEAMRAELLEAVKAEAAAIIEDAKAKAQEEAKKIVKGGIEVTPETEEQLEYANELVPYTAFKDSGKYNQDITVIHNGKAWQIKRGEEVMIPRKIKQIIVDAERQTGLTADLLEGMEMDFVEKTSKL